MGLFGLFTKLPSVSRYSHYKLFFNVYLTEAKYKTQKTHPFNVLNKMEAYEKLLHYHSFGAMKPPKRL